LKFLELCFKHFMGRAPRDREEMRTYCDILMRDGVQTLITALIDSEEYRKQFGCFTVPHPPQEETYGSPKAYLETDILNHELHGRRGKVLPTMLWNDLGMTCEGGHCHLQTEAPMASAQPPAKSQSDFLQMLRSMNPADLEQVASALSPHQREKLRQVLMQPA
ncbi:MAG TPA: phycobilisome rod-core linker polypeptide, partial [Trichocoleus sp.]